MKKGTKRSIRSYAIQRQNEFAKAATFQNREGHGADMVYPDPAGGYLALCEHKNMARFSWGSVEEAMQQAESYARHERGRPVACVGYSDKPGPGKTTKRYLVFRAESWPELAERLGGDDGYTAVPARR